MINNGLVEDPRSIEEKAKDHLHEELFSGLPVTWTEKPESEWKLTSNRDQDGSFSCVKQASSTAVESITGEIISAATYELRSNYPDEGMWLQDCGNIDYDKGTILESSTPSQKLDEPTMNSIKLPDNLNIKITGYRTIFNINIDSIAQAIGTYKNCILVFHANAEEWGKTPIYNGQPITFGHGICGVDFTTINGVKTIVCMDSAGKLSSPTGVRLITEDYLNKRCVGALYYLGANINNSFKHTFNTNLTFGVTNDEVIKLQEALKIDGEFTYPTCTGYFGPITLTAVKAFQSKYGIPHTGFVGPMTRTKLNSLFS